MLTIDLTPQTLAERLAAWEARQRAQLLEEATALQLQVTVDVITGGWAVRSPQRPGYVEIVTEAGCSCAEYAVRGSCPHQAHIDATMTTRGNAEGETR